jgi:hypothetical protein
VPPELLELLLPPLELVFDVLEPVLEPLELVVVPLDVLPLVEPELHPLDTPVVVPEPLLDVVASAPSESIIPKVGLELPLHPAGSKVAKSDAAHAPYELFFIRETPARTPQ